MLEIFTCEEKRLIIVRYFQLWVRDKIYDLEIKVNTSPFHVVRVSLLKLYHVSWI